MKPAFSTQVEMLTLPSIRDIPNTAQDKEPVIPTKIDRYTILRKLGSGGMGVVYSAYDEKLDRKIAIKVLRGDGTLSDSIHQARLLREAQALARLAHPNVVIIYEVGTFDDRVCIVMEFVEGKTLTAWLQEKVRRWPEILSVFVQAGRGIAAAHKAGFVHRDFKPDNVLIGNDGRVRVVDFGLARPIQVSNSEHSWTQIPVSNGEDDGSQSENPSLTRTGALVGTPAYMSPEQFAGGAANEGSDQFSFSVALYEALYQQPPFSQDSLTILMQELEVGKVRTRPLHSDVPVRIHQAILRGLAKEPEQRWPSMQDFLHELDSDLEFDPSISQQQRVMIAGVSLVLVVAIYYLMNVGLKQLALPARLETLLMAIVVSTALAIVFLVCRRAVFRSVFNRRFSAWFLVLCVASVLNRIIGLIAETPVAMIYSHELMTGATISAMAAITVTSWIWWVASQFFLASFVASVWPSTAFVTYITSVAVGLCLVAFFSLGSTQSVKSRLASKKLTS